MGRKALALGEHGDVTLTPVKPLKGGKYETLSPRARSTHFRASVYYMGHDGVRREVRRVVAGTRAQAEADVLEVVRSKLAASDARLTTSTPIVEACRRWLDAQGGEGGSLSASTMRVYESAFNRAIAAKGSPIAGLTLAQANDGQRLYALLSGVAKEHGSGTARHVKAVLSGVLKEAAQYRVIASNELLQVKGVRKVAPKSGGDRDRTRAMTQDELERSLAVADKRANEEGLIERTRAKREATACLMYVLAGTGMRISEALGLQWAHLDAESGRLEVRGTKTASSDRVVTLPQWVLERLAKRIEDGGPSNGYILHAPNRPKGLTRWDSVNANHAVREVLDEAGLTWATSHTYRRSVATKLHSKGVGVNRVADQLGHKDPSLTARTYLGRDLLGAKEDLANLL